jgi:catechol 2,3-dioxygenase-like lactoylglutathione lyase family enzyme
MSASPPGSPKSFIKGVEHVAIATPDPGKLAAWYVEFLNFRPLLDTGATVYIQAPNRVVLEFVKADQAGGKPMIRDSGIRHIALGVNDFEGAHVSLAKAGIQFEPQPVVLPGMRLYFFRDPEGNFLHLVHREQPLPLTVEGVSDATQGVPSGEAHK